ncbi:uncharacterized protein LOC106474604 [Limulus polyphemus]|uniref:Uncharacterized protein LOC106474604 n=1 Tax=Limulus polyphemus TaxID=6850 RepID=A0ABM1TRW7_LIMPO|nr:uncharacterized protein LOC106474604 [Limulus polyphemus]
MMRYELCLTLLLVFSWSPALAQLNSISIGSSTFDRDYTGKSSGCALILQRSYIKPGGRTPATHYGGFLEFVKPRSFHPSGPVEEICIRYSDVNRALAEAKRQRGYRQPSTINSLEPLPPHIDQTAELVLATTRILAKQ